MTKRILDALNKFPDAYFRKVHGSRASSGWPDLIGCAGGDMYAIEVKTPDAKRGVTPLQAAELAKWAKAGAVAAVVYSVDEATDLVKRRNE